MTTEYWTVIGGQPKTLHATLRAAVGAMWSSLAVSGEGPWMCTVGIGGTHEVVDGEHAETLASRQLGTIVLGYRSQERADADRDGAYPDAQVERQEV
jgi:hypothetical protein